MSPPKSNPAWQSTPPSKSNPAWQPAASKSNLAWHPAPPKSNPAWQPPSNMPESKSKFKSPPKRKSTPESKYLQPKSTATYLPILPILTLTSSSPDMDTSAGPSTKRSLRAAITRQYENRVAQTTEKIDPNRTKARELLGDVDNFELEEVEGTFTAPAQRASTAQVEYLDAPLMTLRELMPGNTGDGDDDSELDQAFRADKIEFLVMQRPLTQDEIQADHVLEDVGSIDWSIPTQEEYEDLMGQVLDVYTDDNPYLVDALNWSSVGTTTGVGCFSVKTGNPEHIQDLRGAMRAIMHDGKCFESFPKKPMMKSFNLTAFFLRSTKYVGMGRLIEWLFFCNCGLQGTIWPTLSKKFPDSHQTPVNAVQESWRSREIKNFLTPFIPFPAATLFTSN